MRSSSATDGWTRGFRYRDVARRLRLLGFQFDRQAAGSHEIWYNPGTKRYTTIPNHPGDLPQGTLWAILAQAGVSVTEFLESGR
ncbi:MAG: type II toxin-antitoxin system HicA family toxin [Rhodospirillales bacterium]|nr:type II toxin-antitoxin system HicA family toxin [Rhodospirillales bacterium]